MLLMILEHFLRLRVWQVCAGLASLQATAGIAFFCALVMAHTSRVKSCCRQLGKRGASVKVALVRLYDLDLTVRPPIA